MYQLPKTLLAAAALMLAGPAFAGPPYFPNVVVNGGLWAITAYDDSSVNHTQWATQNICFLLGPPVGTHMSGVWFSTTFFDWNGRWRQEGDQVFMTGDYAGDVTGNAVGHDSIEWEIVTVGRPNEGFGHWREWREDGNFGNTIGFANAKLKRIGACPQTLPATPVPPTVEEIEKFAFELSLEAPRRLREDGSEALGPFDPKQLPLLK